MFSVSVGVPLASPNQLFTSIAVTDRPTRGTKQLATCTVGRMSLTPLPITELSFFTEGHGLLTSAQHCISPVSFKDQSTKL